MALYRVYFKHTVTKHASQCVFPVSSNVPRLGTLFAGIILLLMSVRTKGRGEGNEQTRINDADVLIYQVNCMMGPNEWRADTGNTSGSMGSRAKSPANTLAGSMPQMVLWSLLFVSRC